MSDPINALPPTFAELQRNREPVPSLAPYAIDLTKPVSEQLESFRDHLTTQVSESLQIPKEELLRKVGK
jgi:hypothetical protein